MPHDARRYVHEGDEASRALDRRDVRFGVAHREGVVPSAEEIDRLASTVIGCAYVSPATIIVSPGFGGVHGVLYRLRRPLRYAVGEDIAPRLQNVPVRLAFDREVFVAHVIAGDAAAGSRRRP